SAPSFSGAGRAGGRRPRLMGTAPCTLPPCHPSGPRTESSRTLTLLTAVPVSAIVWVSNDLISRPARTQMPRASPARLHSQANPGGPVEGGDRDVPAELRSARHPVLVDTRRGDPDRGATVLHRHPSPSGRGGAPAPRHQRAARGFLRRARGFCRRGARAAHAG